MDAKTHYTKSVLKNSALIMDLVEGLVGNDPRFPFIRKSILRRINDIKRDGIAVLELATRRCNTAPGSVAAATKTDHLDISQQG